MKKGTCVMFLRGIDKEAKNKFRQVCLANNTSMTQAIEAFMKLVANKPKVYNQLGLKKKGS